MSVKVSVCVPIYGVESYIERCARSLFEQTMKEGIEFIFVNDCTKDKSIEILEKVLAEYPHRKDQVKIIHHEKNGGLVAARKTGLAHASGEYIIHCDSDDWVELDMYEKMYNKAVETDADMVYCDYYESTENKDSLVTHAGTCNAEKLIEEILYGITHGSLWNKLFRRNIALSSELICPVHICIQEDLLRVVQMCTLCTNIIYLKQTCYHYRQSHTQMTAKWSWTHFQNIYQVTLILAQILNENYIPALDFRRRLLALSMIKRRKISSKDFYDMLRPIQTSLFRDKGLNIFKKLIFCIGYYLYPVLPKSININQ